MKEDHILNVSLILFLLAYALFFLCSCASQTLYKSEEGKWVYHTQETLHSSDSSAQMLGQGNVTIREYDRKTGSLKSEHIIAATNDSSIVTVRSNPSGTEAVKLWGLLNLGSDFISGANNIGQDAVKQ